MLRIYKAPDGSTWQYEEGTQPDGYEPWPPEEPKAAPKAALKRRATANKRRAAANKSKGAQDAS